MNFNRRAIEVALHFLVVVYIAAASQAQLAFTEVHQSIGGSHRQMVVADVIGSAADDIVTANSSPLGLLIYDHAAGGAPLSLPLVDIAHGLVAADFDGDGDIDLAAASSTNLGIGAGTLQVYLNNGGPALMSSIPIPFAERLSARDMDLDGDRDLVVGRTILWNDGLGGFSTQTTIASTTPFNEWVPGDFDGDGDIDLATTFNSTTTYTILARIFRRNANGSFTLLSGFPIEPQLGFGSRGFDVRDMNGDGIDDLVVGTNFNSKNHVHVELGGPGLAFTPVPGVVASPWWGNIRLTTADVDADGDIDVVSLTSAAPPVILLNDGQGQLSPAGGRLFAGGSFTGGPALAVGDVDNDGLTDVAALVFATTSTTHADAYRVFRQDPTLEPSTPLFDPIAPTLGAAGYNVSMTPEVQLADGTPCGAQFVSVQHPNPGVPGFSPEYSLTNPQGSGAIASVSMGAPGATYTVNFALPSGATASWAITSVAPITIVGGSNQTTPPGTPFPQPLVVHVIDAYGVSASGRTVHWLSASSGLTLSSTQSTSDANGDASNTVLAVGAPGTYTISASMIPFYFAPPAYAVVTFTLSISPLGTISIVSGADQVTNFASSFAQPFSIHAVTTVGQDAAGIPILFIVTQGGATLSQTIVATNSLGQAAITATPTTGGAITLRASSPNFGFVEFDLFCRRLRVVPGPFLFLTEYHHEHPAIPLALMIDAPLPSPGAIATAYGPLFVSALSPGPIFFALDGFGAFGPIDPSLITNSTGLWMRNFFNVPSFGLSWVTQVLAYDVAYPWPGSIILSNPSMFVY